MANQINVNADGSYSLPSTGQTWAAGTDRAAFGADAVFQNAGQATPASTTPAAQTNTAPTQDSSDITNINSGSTTNQANQQIQSNMNSQAAGTTSLNSNETMQPTYLQNSQNQELNVPGLGATQQPNASTAGPSSQVATPDPNAASTYQAQLTGYQNAAQGTAAQMDPNAAQTATAAQGTVDPNSLIQNQYAAIMKTADASGVPDFAKPAARAVNDQMAARGMGSSTLSAEATAFGIMQAIFPMAQFNANLYADLNKINLNNQQQANITNAQQKFQAQIANLSNSQQMDMANLQTRQQVLLTDQAAQNASQQFNAQNEQQNQQFQSSLLTQISLNNAQRADALASFNAGQTNAMDQFNASLADSRDKFNVQNQQLIDQSNVNWRRQINTVNTAAANAAMQTNAQNTFNMTQTAQANLWQQWRDEASWANTDSENALNRAQNMAIASLQSSTYFQGLDYAQQSQLYSQLGSFAINLLNGFGKSNPSTPTTAPQAQTNPFITPPPPNQNVDQFPGTPNTNDGG